MRILLSSCLGLLALTACASLQPKGPEATATLRPASGSRVAGQVTFTQIAPERVRVVGEITGHGSGLKGFHIHEKGDCSAADATSAGGHLNPTQAKHGSSPTSGHAGDMGNLAVNVSGGARIDLVLQGLSVSSDARNGIVGRAVIVHMEADDLTTDPAGNAGARAACGVIVQAAR